jgi:hypothetical protein
MTDRASATGTNAAGTRVTERPRAAGTAPRASLTMVFAVMGLGTRTPQPTIDAQRAVAPLKARNERIGVVTNG